MNEEEKKASISAYLCEKFSGSKVELNYDFDLRAQSFLILLHDREFLLKVSIDFINDNSTTEIFSKFELWSLTKRIEKETKTGVLVTNSGLLSLPARV